MAYFTEWTPELAAELARPFPPEQMDFVKKGGKHAFIPWYHVAARLDQLVGPGGWEVSMPKVTTVAGENVRRIQVALSLRILGVSKGQVGERDLTSVDEETGEIEDFDGYGSPAVNAYAQALKRAAAMFAVGRYLYNARTRDQVQAGAQREEAPPQPQRRRLPAPPSAVGKLPATANELAQLRAQVRDCPITTDERTRILTRIDNGDMTGDDLRALRLWLDRKKHASERKATADRV